MSSVVVAFEHQRVAARQARLDVRASDSRGRSARRAASWPSEQTNCTGSRASCGTGNGRTSIASIAKRVMAVETVHARQPGEALGDGGQSVPKVSHTGVP